MDKFGSPTSWARGPYMKTTWTTPTSHIILLAKICPQSMPYNEGSYGIKPLALLQKNKETFTENLAYEPTFVGMRTPTSMAYEPWFLCHMNWFYWGRGLRGPDFTPPPPENTLLGGGGYKRGGGVLKPLPQRGVQNIHHPPPPALKTPSGQKWGDGGGGGKKCFPELGAAAIVAGKKGKRWGW